MALTEDPTRARPSDPVYCMIFGLTTGIGAVINTAKVESGTGIAAFSVFAESN